METIFCNKIEKKVYPKTQDVEKIEIFLRQMLFQMQINMKKKKNFFFLKIILQININAGLFKLAKKGVKERRKIMNGKEY